jgi:tetratricopeptide (TPR) repeat protein
MRIPSLFSKCLISFLIPAIVTQPLYGMHDNTYLKSQSFQDPFNSSKQITYDRVLQYLDDIESGVLESRCKAQDLDKINAWLIYLARTGVIPGDTEAESLLEIDIEELDEDESSFEYGSYYDGDERFMLIPTITANNFESFICKSWLSKKWKQTKKFIKDHKKEILIGAAIIVGAAVVVACVSLGAAATAVGGAAVGASESNQDKDKSNIKASDVHDQTSTIRQDVLTKELVALEDKNFPLEENARLLGQASAQLAFEKVLNSVSCNTYFSSDLEKMGGLTPETAHLIDVAFSKPISWYSWDYSNGFKENVYAARGSYALNIKAYDQAFSDFGKALELNSNNADVYLNRAFANLETGNITAALKDFDKHKAVSSLAAGDIYDFSIEFLKNGPLGAKDSCEGSCEFVLNVACHPIVTSKQMISAINYLKEVAVSGEWADMAQILAPELSELVLNWDNLSYKERGARSGYIFGKYGTDCLIGGGLMKAGKLTASQIKGLVAARKVLIRAEQTLAIENAMSFSKTSSSVFEEVGAKVGAGLSEEAMLSSIQKFKKAKEFLSSYKGQYMPEAQLRNLIKEAGLEAVPRPKGIPESFRVKISDKCSGIVYMHPENNQTSVRVMFGKPHSPWPAQQKSYIVVQKDGKFLDKNGISHVSESPEIHIPLEEFDLEKCINGIR